MTSELGENPDELETRLAVLSRFYQGDKRHWSDCLLDYYNLINEPLTKFPKLDLDFENKPAEYFITADIYVQLADLLSLYNHLSGKKEKSISVQLARHTKDVFLSSVEHFKEKYEWIYNPPMIGKAGAWTPGKSARQDFAQDYGAYAEITYLLSSGDALKFDEVNKMKLSEYLAKGEYLLRKKAVESIE